MITSSQVALQVAQEAISVLAKWADANLPNGCQPPEELHPAVIRAKSKEILSWPDNKLPDCLRLLFDAVKLPDGKGQDKNQQYYCPAVAIANEHPTIPYPQPEPPTDAELNKLKSEIKQALNQLEGNWDNLSLLTLILEKFGSCLSFGESDVALIDMARSTAAVAAALTNNPKASHLSLVAGDLSGIQKFIYTISSDGALKSLRARSFYLELVTEEIVQQILTELDLPRTNVIYAGGGNLYILSNNDEKKVNQALNTVSDRLNKWLITSFQGKVFLALDYLPIPTESVGKKEFAGYWNQVPKKLAKQKLRKFESQLNDFLKPSLTYEPCRVCHRDDLPKLKQLNRHEPDSSAACWMCRTVFELGDKLFRKKVIVRSKISNLKRGFELGERLSLPGFYYYFFDKPEQALEVKGAETVFLVNNWEVENYRKNTVPLLLGNYGKVIETENGAHYIRAGEMADAAKKAGCIPRVGYLRMDVDKLGQIFAKGLNEKQTLPRLAGLSRQMSYFFKVYLNSLAEFRKRDFLEPGRTVKVLEKVKCLREGYRQNLLFIYAGGDDLFVSGAWNEVVEFAFDVYQCFHAYTGNNPDITLSGGISLSDVKFPLYQAAAESGKAEAAAKSNGRDSLGLFGEKFKWSEWLGRKDVEVSEIEVLDSAIKAYLERGSKIEPLELFGILPFIQILEDPEISYSRTFVRNLLDTANLQNQKIEEINQKIKEIEDERKQEEYTNQKKDIRYYLHLPQIAYTLARLPKEVREHKKFKPVRTSLKSPYNAPYFRAIATWIELLNRSSDS